VSRRSLSPDTQADIDIRRILDDRNHAGFTVIAGAGSGKTTSLVKALTHVIKSRGDDLRSRGQKVACITYTEIAAREISNELGNDALVHVSTIHSYLWTLARPFQNDIRRWVRCRVETLRETLLAEQAGYSNRVQQKRRDATEARIQRLSEVLPRIEHIDIFTYGTGTVYERGILGHEEVITMVPQLITTKPLFAKLVGQQYPLVFVDESQDTLREVVDCLRHVSLHAHGDFCLGFFGDPMQKIYVRGIGSIPGEEDWVQVKKPQNFRSPQRVLDVINAVRADDDGLHQVTGLPEERQRPGEVNFFVLPADETRSDTLRETRRWLAANSPTGAWTSSSGVDDTKILVIAHRMAARRLGFENLYDIFHTSALLGDAFDEGRAWPLAPFLLTLVPLSKAATTNRSELVSILRRSSPLLRGEGLGSSTMRDRLQVLASGVEELVNILTVGGPGSVEQALLSASRTQLIDLDPRLAYLLAETKTDPVSAGVPAELESTIRDFFACDVHELEGYFSYIDQESPYSTHQGVKGAEYPHVLVVLDDEEGKHNQFSYDKLLKITPLSPNDLKREQAGEETTVQRTRRLLYVCASRATEALAIVLYARDVDAALQTLRASGIPGSESARTLRDMSTKGAQHG
jgi:DNA helicase-2/ATP-dependent DNA helicase PcrA